VLLESHTASASSTLDFTTRNAADFTGPTFQSDFDEYVVELVNVKNATNTQALHMRISPDSGSSWVAGSNYHSGFMFGASNGSHSISNSSGAAQVLLMTGVDNTSEGVSGSVKLFDPFTGFRKSGTFDLYAPQAIAVMRAAGFLLNTGTATYNAIQFYYASGNITSGTIRVYGISKTGRSGLGAASGEWSIRFTPLSNNPPVTNSAGLDTRNATPVLEFDTATQETAMFASVVPENYGGGSIVVCAYWAADTATSGTIGWDFAFERIGEEIQDLDADGFGSDNVITATAVSATSGMVKKTCADAPVGATIDSLVAGDAFRLRVRRNVAADDAAGDAQLIAVTMKEPD
jgi:hypothetical protein